MEETIPLSPCEGSPLTGRSKLSKFWTSYGKDLDDAQAQADCDHFHKRFQYVHGCVVVDNMSKVAHNSVCSILGERQRLGWCTSIESLLGQQFPRGSSTEPGSAHMGDEPPTMLSVSSSSTSRGGGTQTERFAPKRKLGEYLQRRDELHLIDPPFHTFHSIIDFECADPANEMLTANDTTAVSEEIFKYMVAKHNYVAGDKILETNLGKKIKKHYPVAYGNKEWSDIVKNRKKNGRCKAGIVRSCPPTSLPPPHTLSPLLPTP